MARPINSVPALGNPTTQKGVLNALKAPLAAIPDSDGTDPGRDVSINAILAALRTLGLISS